MTMEAEFSLPVGHTRTISLLKRILKGEKMGQSYLFAGKEGIGKYLVARWFAAGVLCTSREERPCLECNSCRRVAKGVHVDLKEVAPDGRGLIPIDAVREIQEWLNLSPMEGTRKALLIDDAHLMNIPAANAFLKTLEEPPPSAVIVLVSANPMWLLPTIRSRCQVVWFSPLSTDEVRMVLGEMKVEEFESLFAGSPGRLLQMLSSPNLHEMREAADRIVRGRGDWSGVVGRHLRGRKGWVRETDEVMRLLFLLHGAIRQRMVEGDDSPRLFELYERVTLLEEEMFMYNLNPQLVIESLVGM